VNATGLVRRLRATVEAAKAMPLSASALINRREVLDLLGQLEAALDGDGDHAPESREHLDPQVRDARQQAAAVIDAAKQARSKLLADSEIVRAARDLAARLRAEAQQESAELRTETDEYVDGRLAELEISLNKTLDVVKRGRERLHGRSHFDSLAPVEEVAGQSDDGNLSGADPNR
jgi:hypothetical protein